MWFYLVSIAVVVIMVAYSQMKDSEAKVAIEENERVLLEIKRWQDSIEDELRADRCDHVRQEDVEVVELWLDE